jgi:hypothetical protein
MSTEQKMSVAFRGRGLTEFKEKIWPVYSPAQLKAMPSACPDKGRSIRHD